MSLRQRPTASASISQSMQNSVQSWYMPTVKPSSIGKSRQSQTRRSSTTAQLFRTSTFALTMTARRQASTTSLSKFARAGSPDLSARSSDFCNAFWGLGDGGVDVLFARMRGAARTMEELRNFWKERSLIEEDYGKRLAKLAKTAVGRDEIGEFRNSLDTLRQETEKQSGFHLHLSQQIRNDLEGPASAFVARQVHHRKTYQSAIEKQFKNKQAQEAHVNKAREKYEADCLRINSYTAQSSLVQGKDLERINVKLERAQQTVQANERDFANFARALQDSVAKWEQEWKVFCDSCQDMEDDRMEFTKDNVWAYANAVSIVCVSDDESCERLRLALEQFEPEKDQENFVHDYGTGNLIPDPPHFISYSSAEGGPLPSANSKPVTRPAQFTRSSQRATRLPSAAPPQQDEETLVNTAGVGAGGRSSMGDAPRSQSRASARVSVAPSSNPNGTTPINGGSSSQSHSGTGRPGTGGGAPLMADPTTHKTMLVVGDNAYEVDVNKNPQRQQQQPQGGSRSGVMSSVGGETDPMVEAMTKLRNEAGSVGRSATRKNTLDNSIAAGSSSTSPLKNLGPPAPSNDRNRDYRNSAELVVGSYPLQAPSSRPSSPGAPTAAFMRPPQHPAAPVVENVLGTYQQSFPGEVEQRRSRSNSRRGSFNGQQNLDRPVSREGHAGIGANGRSPSPSLRHPVGQPPLGPPSRSVSPAVGGGANLDYRSSGRSQNALSPNSVGIQLDPNGNVAMDSMAEAYQHHQQRPSLGQAPPPQQPPPTQYQPPVQQQLHAPPGQAVQRRPSVSNGYPPQNQYGVSQQSPTRSYGFQPTQGQQQPAYGVQHPQGYSAASNHPYANAASAQMYSQPPPPQPVGYGQPVNGAGRQGGAVHRGPSASGDYYQGQPQHQGYGSQPQQGGYGGYRGVSPGPANRSPSPQPLALTQPPQQHPQVVPPTRQYTEDGRGVLFYVKALYDYTATIPEEFDFQSGDIIAVTATPEDGWWSGELLDEARRVPGRHIFPSNFVHLF